VLLQQFGVTPVELAQTQRLLFAKKLLQETRLSMADVAYASGFGSVRRFNALFSQRYGIAPGEIRRAAAGTQEDALTLRLAYRPPFDWKQMLLYLGGRAIPGVEAVTADGAGSYLRSVHIDGAQGWLRVRHLPKQHQLHIDIAPALASVLMPLLARLRAQFDLDANPEIIAAHLRQDRLLAARIDTAPGLRVPGAFDAFELAVRAILGQQVSVAGATTLSGRLVQRYGDPAEDAPHGVTHHFPRAEVLAAADPGNIARIGLPDARAQAICSLAGFAAQGGLQIRPGATLAETIACLRSVRGIGDWTAHYIALRALRFPDAFPAGDLGLQKAAAADQTITSSGRLTEKQLVARAAGWAPWRGYAALILWSTL
jgi:AraC family transcriptional regulator, regulatory protein of adaptative response / DNA-3-methyladenine glycosylase II